MIAEQVKKCGYVAIVGRPNVGKSTLLNYILGQKITITSKKAQTTRHRILGIKTEGEIQTIYVDTPGIHAAGKKVMNRVLNKAAFDSLYDVDVVLFMIEEMIWKEQDEKILERIAQLELPVILVVNKIDQLRDKQQLLPFFQKLSEKAKFVEMIPISAENGENVAQLEQAVEALLPASGAFFPEDQVTDRSERFLASELIREKLTRNLGQELPYSLTVEIEKYEIDDKGTAHIYGLIWVERDTQKAIVIGKQGELLKKVGSQARKELEANLGSKVFLKLWVKVKSNWADDERALRNFGYHD